METIEIIAWSTILAFALLLVKAHIKMTEEERSMKTALDKLNEDICSLLLKLEDLVKK